MILIISAEFDESTFWVIKWLKQFNADYLRINSFNDSVHHILDILKGKGKTISSVWYRRKNAFVSGSFEESADIEENFVYSLTQEVKVFNEYLFYALQHAKWINHPDRGSVNKLIVLEQARAVGLSVADFIITDNKAVLLAFCSRHNQIISKPISNISPLTYQDERFIPYTQILQPTVAAQLPAKFFISFFQVYIPKKFEVRSFYLDGQFYSMAIMSQQNVATKEDFRNYDFETPNRFLPYQLPAAIETKLTLLMDKLGLNSGSLDIIKAEDGNFYFLEVNPVGQFGMVSYPCNYNLEKIIAQKLIEYEINH